MGGGIRWASIDRLSVTDIGHVEIDFLEANGDSQTGQHFSIVFEHKGFCPVEFSEDDGYHVVRRAPHLLGLSNFRSESLDATERRLAQAANVLHVHRQERLALVGLKLWLPLPAAVLVARACPVAAALVAAAASRRSIPVVSVCGSSPSSSS
ncbi:hypothetical protein PFISCL1PPCAC_8765, partial [Pristionchus fissidentatus]